MHSGMKPRTTGVGEKEQNGDVEARTALYATFQKNAAQDQLIGGDELVFLDGVDGLLFLVDHYNGLC